MEEIEKINMYKIRGVWQEIERDGFVSGGDDTLISIVMVAEKLNEVIEKLNQSKE